MNLYQNWSESIAPILGETALNSVLWAAIFALLGFFAAIVVIVALQRRKLLYRTLWIWNVFAKLSYLLIMLSFLMTGVSSGVLFGVQRTLDRALVATMKPALEAQMPALRQQLIAYIGPMARDRMLTARDLVEPIVKELVYTPKNDGLLETMKAKIANEMLYESAAYAMTEAFQQVMKNMAKFLEKTDFKVGENFFKAGENVVEVSADAMLKVLIGIGEHVDFTALDATVPDIFTAAMQKQLNSLFYSLYIGLFIKLLFVALLIGAEILIYFKYYLPRKQPVEPELA